MKIVFALLVCCLVIFVTSCKNPPRENPPQNTKTSVVASPLSVSGIVRRGAISQEEIKEIRSMVRRQDFSIFKIERKAVVFDFLKLAIKSMNGSIDNDAIYEIITGIQTTCLEVNQEEWLKWIEGKDPNNVFWVF